MRIDNELRRALAIFRAMPPEAQDALIAIAEALKADEQRQEAGEA